MEEGGFQTLLVLQGYGHGYGGPWRTPAQEGVDRVHRRATGRPAETASNSDQSEDSPPPLPERTPESFILATDPSELKAPGPSDWSISEDQSVKGAGFPQEQRSTQAQTAEREPSGERSKKISDAAGVETSPANTTVADSSAESKASSEMGYGNRCTQPKGPRNPYTVDMIMASTYSPLHCPPPPPSPPGSSPCLLQGPLCMKEMTGCCPILGHRHLF
ncbi:tyrosine-protein phosphatase non-receptor type 12-like [Oncorhynchus masou masou]|uniref:tyrosine-protein phosphatase non-receptor type 12-like n=1 Tax=Oncorhynchus masou masou TaxID=90313 RepID=UPI00318433DC